jgi:hypothetical protein
MSASLAYEADPLLSSCPSPSDFQTAIVRHLHYDPFGANPVHHIVARIQRSGGGQGQGLEGRVEWRDADDHWEGERSFSSPKESCSDIARTMALATAIQIQFLNARVADAGTPSAGDGAPAAAAPGEAAPPRVQAPIPVAVQRTGTLTPSSDDPHLALELGAGLIRDAGNGPTFAVPRLVLLVGRPSATGVRLVASGLGPAAHVSHPGGTARVDRFVATVELIRFFRGGHRVQPLVAAGAGLQVMRVEGVSDMPVVAPGHDGRAISGVLAAGAGLAFAFARRLAFVVEVDTFVFRPSLTVQIASAAAARLDGAAVFAHGGLLARF